MPRTVKQTLPTPPPVYDQAYMAQLVAAVNRYMTQRDVGEMIAARFIMTDVPIVDASNTKPNEYPDTSQLPTGTIYAKPINAVKSTDPVLTVVLKGDK